MCRFFTACILLLSLTSEGQEFPIRKLHERTLPTEVIRTSVDRLGNGYVLGKDRLIKLSTEGEILSERKIGYASEIISLECWNPLRIWIHRASEKVHQIELLDQKLLNEEEPLRIDPSFAVEPTATTPGNTNATYWILDSDNTLKFIQSEKGIVEWESDPITALKANFSMIRSYQGFIFLLDSAGLLYVVNRLGKLVRTIETGKATQFGVLGEDIYFLSNGKIIFENIYTESTYAVALPAAADHVLATDERLMLFKGSVVQVFSFKPGN